MRLLSTLSRPQQKVLAAKRMIGRTAESMLGWLVDGQSSRM
jgi:hypothetical protein